MIQSLSIDHCQTCPVCGARISKFAVVDSDTPGSPSDPFWGDGDRALLHKLAGAWCHFRVGTEHRLAYLAKLAKP